MEYDFQQRIHSCMCLQLFLHSEGNLKQSIISNLNALIIGGGHQTPLHVHTIILKSITCVDFYGPS